METDLLKRGFKDLEEERFVVDGKNSHGHDLYLIGRKTLLLAGAARNCIQPVGNVFPDVG
jgi:hypothetical protein